MTDYPVAVWIRYGLYLAACGIARAWVLPDAWALPVATATLFYAGIVVHTEPAARYARRLRNPWYGWMALSAVCAHAFGAAAVYALLPVMDLRYALPDTEGMRFEKLWVDEPSLLEVGTWIAGYALLSAAWATGAGWVSRRVWGAAMPEQHLVRIRRPAVRAPSAAADEAVHGG